MNVVVKPPLSVADGLLMDVARKIQLSRTKHETAVSHYIALCEYVDREGSPLHGKVVECYPGGSFATGTAVASKVSKNQHDVDVVIELDCPPTSDPAVMLQTLFAAINGEEGSRYHGKVKLNSRCVTVEYDDNTTVDLMPVSRFTNAEPRAGNLFHFKVETNEKYHKPVNPWGFAKHFNDNVQEDREFYEAFAGRRMLVEALQERAETQPMPDHAPMEEKSSRVVALQLIKRARDIVYRKRPGRKPPSIVVAALALKAGPPQRSLIDEVIAVATFVRNFLVSEASAKRRARVFNPAYKPDEFTDRWPEDTEAQMLFAGDLRRLTVSMHRLKNEDLSLEEIKNELQDWFGETAAQYAVEGYLDSRRGEAQERKLRFTPSGRVITGIGASAALAGRAAAKTNTFEGGGSLPE